MRKTNISSSLSPVLLSIGIDVDKYIKYYTNRVSQIKIKRTLRFVKGKLTYPVLIFVLYFASVFFISDNTSVSLSNKALNAFVRSFAYLNLFNHVNLPQKQYDISIQGNKIIRFDVIENIIYDSVNSKNSMFIDLQSAKEAIKNLPAVKNVIIQKVIPDKIFVKISENGQIASYKSQNGQIKVLDESGIISTMAHFQESEVGAMAKLICKQNCNREFLRFYKETISSFPELWPQITAAERIQDRRWNLVLQDKVLVKMPEDSQVAKTLRAFREANKKLQLLNQESKTTYINLTVYGKIFVN